MAGKRSEYKGRPEAVEKLKKTNKYAYLFVPLLLVLADYFAVLCAEEISFLLRDFFIKTRGALRITRFHFYVIAPIIYITYLNIHGLYTRKMQSWRIIASIFKANLYAVLTGVFILFMVRPANATTRLYMIMLCFLGFFFIVLFRFLLRRLFDWLHLFEEPVLIIGAGLTAAILLQHIKSDIGLNYHVVGYLEDYTPNRDVAAQLPRLGKFADAEAVIKETSVQHVMVTAPGLTQTETQDIVYRLQPLVKSISFIPDMGKLPLATMDIESLVDGHLVMMQMRNNLKDKWNRSVKFIFDWVITLVGTLFLSPLFLLIALWVYIDSPGPIIFKQKRVGRNGKEFYCYKFRTMCVDAKEKLEDLLKRDPEAKKEWEANFKLKNDPRITSSGHFLRSTSLDELPQVWNVLKGEMSLVGPRPIIREEIHYYGKYIDDYFLVRPGITGIWQTSGRSNTEYADRVQMDTWYVRNWNIWFDIVLLWRTFKVVIKREGAY